MDNTTLKTSLLGLSLLTLTQVSTAGTMGPASAPSWSGVYAGLNAGALWGSTKFYTTDYGIAYTPEQVSFFNSYLNATLDDSAAFLGGGQVGANYQTGSFVLGLEADLDYTNLDNSRELTNPANPAIGVIFPSRLAQNISADWLSTIRGRLGFAQNNWLIFGTGGLAITRAQFSDTLADLGSTTPGINSTSTEKTAFGWTAGAGVEWMYSPALSLKAEYLYVDFENISYSNPYIITGVVSNSFGFVNNHELSGNIARVGVNYRFNA